MKAHLNDGEAYVEGRSPEKAKELVEKLNASGIEGRIRTTSFGYIVPAELVEDGQTEEADLSAPDGVNQTEGESTGTVTAPADADDATVEAVTEQAETEAAETGDYDPADGTVEEVTAYLDNADDAEIQRVIALEAEGKNRKGITSYESEGAK